MSLKLFFTQTEFEEQERGWEGCDWAVTMREHILRRAHPAYEITDDPERSDIIVFWEPHQRSEQVRIPKLRAHPLVHKFPNRVFVVSVEDLPLGLLSGLYAALPVWRHHPHRHRTTLFYRTQNPYLRSLRAGREVTAPPNLASFTGSECHWVRRRLFELSDAFAEQAINITRSPRNHFLIEQDPDLKPLHLSFIDTILDAKFSLCPRGHGPATYRLQESMALGRAPVIISDEWAPAAGVDWKQFAIFVPEGSLPHLPAILHEYEPRWKEMGNIAKQIYEAHFCPEVFALRVVDQIAAIYHGRRHDERHFFAHWDLILAEAERQKAQ